MTDRIEAVNALLTFSKPLNCIARQLSQFGWDYESSPAILYSSHMIAALERFLSGELTAYEIEEWANLVECREDIKYAGINQAILEESVFSLANPTLQGQITTQVCTELIDRLKANI